MEIWKVLVVTVVVVIALCGLIYTIHLLSCEQKKRIYVYPKTKNQYYAKGIVKMKDMDSGEWIDAVLYMSLKNGHYYVREKRQFLDKFITLKEWEENGGNDKSNMTTEELTALPKVELHCHLDGLPESANQFKNIAKGMIETYVRKNHDYGNSFDKSLDKFGLVASVVRIGDKMNRIESLVQKKAMVQDESIRDTLLDMANYAIMTVMWMDNQTNTCKV